MKIIELFNNQKIEEALSDKAKGAAKSVGKGALGLAKGANAFISGATKGEVDIGRAINKYTNIEQGKEAGTTRSVGRQLAPEQQFNNLLNNIYGKSNVTPELISDWEDAIKSNDNGQVAQIGKKYKTSEKPEQQDPSTGKWKTSNRDIVAHLMKNLN